MQVRNRDACTPFALALGVALLAGAGAAQSSKSPVGIHELEHGLVHPTILPKLKENSRQMEGMDLALNPALPFRVKLTPGKRRGEFLIEAEPKVGITRLILPGLVNAKLVDSQKREKSVRFEIWEARDSLWICNHCGALAALGGHEIWFVDMDQDGVFGEVTDGYVVKPPKEKYWTDPEGRVKFRSMSEPLVVDGAQHWLQPDGRGYSMVVSTSMPDFASQRDVTYEESLRLLNGWRQQLGHAAVTLRADLSRACEEHALYCASNGVLSHDQDPKRPGASPRGANAGAASELAMAKTMDDGLRLWLGTFFHRIRMLSPGLQRVGMGQIQGVAVLDAQSDGMTRQGEPWHWPLDKAVNVPFAWSTGETPSPIGDTEFTSAVAAMWGYPITVTFATKNVSDVDAKVTVDGRELPVFVSSPAAPSNKEFPDNACSILVMTRAPMPSAAIVEVAVKCLHGGKPWTKTWRFTTQSR
ncbi:MAG TPA: CAP domain-containing protein [Planctomycetota bacterium]|nr:CAP domain-containing protein [Planctomycetota bacterium]